MHCRMKTDLGTDSGPHPVHCRLTRCQSIFVDRHRSNSTSRVGSMHPLTLAHHYQYGAEFDEYLGTLVTVHQSHYRRTGLPTNCHHLLPETQHVSLPFITTGPGADSASPGDTELLNQSSPVFLVDRSNSIVLHHEMCPVTAEMTYGQCSRHVVDLDTDGRWETVRLPARRVDDTEP